MFGPLDKFLIKRGLKEGLKIVEAAPERKDDDEEKKAKKPESEAEWKRYTTR